MVSDLASLREGPPQIIGFHVQVHQAQCSFVAVEESSGDVGVDITVGSLKVPRVVAGVGSEDPPVPGPLGWVPGGGGQILA
jgi:hypothetical protein